MPVGPGRCWGSSGPGPFFLPTYRSNRCSTIAYGFVLPGIGTGPSPGAYRALATVEGTPLGGVVVPEPGALTLLGIGAAGLVGTVATPTPTEQVKGELGKPQRVHFRKRKVNFLRYSFLLRIGSGVNYNRA